MRDIPELYGIARAVTEQVLGGAPFAVWDTVQHPTDGLVKIVGGQYYSNGRLSNFWYWQKVNTDGSLDAEKLHGYGWRV